MLDKLHGDHYSSAPTLAIDRGDHQRESAETLSTAWEDTTTLVVLAGEDGVLTAGGALAHFAPEDLPAQFWTSRGAGVEEYTGSRPVLFLGTDAEGHSVLWLSLAPEEQQQLRLSHDQRFQPARAVAPLLEQLDSEAFFAGLGLSNWHSRHAHCPLCGALTAVISSGWVRRCTEDGSLHFPRTDAAIITTVINDADELLLANNMAWEPERFSTLAGFVEPGESLEQALKREVAEEVGVVVTSLRYCGSQSWPFPASLMLGFEAKAEQQSPAVDGVEIRSARWFSRRELRSEVERGAVILPGKASISRALIDRWLMRSRFDEGESGL